MDFGLLGGWPAGGPAPAPPAPLAAAAGASAPADAAGAPASGEAFVDLMTGLTMAIGDAPAEVTQPAMPPVFEAASSPLIHVFHIAAPEIVPTQNTAAQDHLAQQVSQQSASSIEARTNDARAIEQAPEQFQTDESQKVKPSNDDEDDEEARRIRVIDLCLIVPIEIERPSTEAKVSPANPASPASAEPEETAAPREATTELPLLFVPSVIVPSVPAQTIDAVKSTSDAPIAVPTPRPSAEPTAASVRRIVEPQDHEIQTDDHNVTFDRPSSNRATVEPLEPALPDQEIVELARASAPTTEVPQHSSPATSSAGPANIVAAPMAFGDAETTTDEDGTERPPLNRTTESARPRSDARAQLARAMTPGRAPANTDRQRVTSIPSTTVTSAPAPERVQQVFRAVADIERAFSVPGAHAPVVSVMPAQAMAYLMPHALRTEASGQAPASDLPESTTRQIIQSIRLAWTRGAGEARITLDPAKFGGLSVEMRVSRGEVVARLSADSPAVREWILNNQDVLRSGLAEHQLRLDRLEVRAAGEPDDAQGREDQEGRDAERHTHGQRRRKADTGEVFDFVA